MFTVDDQGAYSADLEASEPIGPLVRRVRRQRELSQYALAEALVALSSSRGLGRSDVSRWERGKRVPRPYWRTWLSDALAAPPEEPDEVARAARKHRQFRWKGNR